MSSASPRRRQLLEAALHVIADEGLRGLTHRAVDRRAGLPEGTCSAYLRTRSALQGALTEYVAEALLSDVDRLAERLRLDCECEQESVDAALSLFLHWLDQRELLIARLELSMAATRDPELARLLADHRARLVTLVEGIMATTGKPHVRERAETLVASYDGVLLSALLRSPAERPEFLARSLELIGEQLSSEAPARSEA